MAATAAATTDLYQRARELRQEFAQRVRQKQLDRQQQQHALAARVYVNAMERHLVLFGPDRKRPLRLRDLALHAFSPEFRAALNAELRKRGLA